VLEVLGIPAMPAFYLKLRHFTRKNAQGAFALRRACQAAGRVR
jgi:hypothetical protein